MCQDEEGAKKGKICERDQHHPLLPPTKNPKPNGMGQLPSYTLSCWLPAALSHVLGLIPSTFLLCFPFPPFLLLLPVQLLKFQVSHMCQIKLVQLQAFIWSCSDSTEFIGNVSIGKGKPVAKKIYFSSPTSMRQLFWPISIKTAQQVEKKAHLGLLMIFKTIL